MKTRFLGIIWSACLLGMLQGCAGEDRDASNYKSESIENVTTGPITARGCHLPFGHRTIMVDSIPVDLVMPESNYVGDLLVLPPWNAGRADWCTHARFCSKAIKRGYRLIMPEMGRSIYAQTVYPETRQDWKSFPTIKWVKESLIPEVQNNYCLLKEDGQNFVLGASSGARGAILLAEELPELFVGVAALSGDYNPAAMKGDNIYRGFLGEYELFPSRWETAENALEGTRQITAAVYLGHGQADRFVPYQQTQRLHDLLKTQHPKMRLQLHLPEDRGNDFAFWGSETTHVFDFFESIQASGPEGAMQ